MRNTRLIIAALLALSAIFASAQEEVRDSKPVTQKKVVEDAQNTEEQARRDALLRLFTKAIKGDPEAAYQMGQHYQAGVYVNRDPEKAMSFYEKAADAGSPEAMYQIGAMYYRGTDIERDMGQAVAWFKKAADKKFLVAYLTLGYLYLEPSVLMERDVKQAEYYYRLAADQGNIEGVAYLGRIHFLKDNFSQAFLYLNRAAGEGNAVAKAHLAYLYLNGKGVGKDLDKAMEYAKSAVDDMEQPMPPDIAKMAGNVYRRASMMKMRQSLHSDDSE
jgi:uncharacterized protein